MLTGSPATEIRGTEVRCSGDSKTPHTEVVIAIPADEVVTCPKCGRTYRRAGWWNKISGAIWPRAR